MVSNEEIKRRLDAKRRGIQYNEPVGRRVVEKETKECPDCHTENPTTAKFCVGCGKKLETQREEAFTPTIKGSESETEEAIIESEERPAIGADKEESKVTARPDDFAGAGTQRISSKPSTSMPSKSDITEPTAVKSEKLEPIIPKISEPKESEKVEPVMPQTPEPSKVKTTKSGSSKEETENIHPDIDPVERIKKAKELLDIGALTQEEFDMIKNKYLKEI